MHACGWRWRHRRNRCQPHPMHGPGHRRRRLLLRFDLPQRARCHPAPGERRHHPVDHQSEQSCQLPSGQLWFGCCRVWFDCDRVWFGGGRVTCRLCSQ